VPQLCPKRNGRLKYKDDKYECTNDVDAYVKCQFKAAEVQRLPFVPPGDTGVAFLDGFQFEMVAMPKTSVYGPVLDRSLADAVLEATTLFTGMVFLLYSPREHNWTRSSWMPRRWRQAGR
jgi:hypothetical protein